MVNGYFGEKGIGVFHRDTVLLGIENQCCPQKQEEEVYRHQGKAEGHHILLCIAQISATEILLHHLLIEPCHHNGDKDTADNLFQPKALVLPVGYHTLRKFAMPDFSYQPPGVEPHFAGNQKKRKHNGTQHKGGLEGIGPDNGPYTPLKGVK